MVKLGSAERQLPIRQAARLSQAGPLGLRQRANRPAVLPGGPADRRGRVIRCPRTMFVGVTGNG
jgi:hypothetical protein